MMTPSAYHRLLNLFVQGKLSAPLSRLLLDAMNEHDKESRLMFMLLHLDGLSVQTVASYMNCSVNHALEIIGRVERSICRRLPGTLHAYSFAAESRSEKRFGSLSLQ